MTNEELQEINKILQTIHADVSAIKQELKGYDGNEGLCEQVKQHGKAINKIWIAIAILMASIGGNTYGLIQVLLGG